MSLRIFQTMPNLGLPKSRTVQALTVGIGLLLTLIFVTYSYDINSTATELLEGRGKIDLAAKVAVVSQRRILSWKILLCATCRSDLEYCTLQKADEWAAKIFQNGNEPIQVRLSFRIAAILNRSSRLQSARLHGLNSSRTNEQRELSSENTGTDSEAR